MSAFEDAMKMMSMNTKSPVSEGAKKPLMNGTHFVNVLARVYSKVAAVYDATKAYNEPGDLEDLVNANNLFSLCAHKGKVADCDVVSIIESVKWSLDYLQNGNRTMLRPVLIQDSSMPVTDMSGKYFYNAFMCDFESIEGTGFYEEYSRFNPGVVLSVQKIADYTLDPEFGKEN